MWDDHIDVRQIQELRLKTTCYLGVGAIDKIKDIAADLKARGISKAIAVTGSGAYKSTGAWDHVQAGCKANGIELVLYDRVKPNPTTDSIDEAAKMGAEFGAQAVIAIGGGSPIDAGKSVAILLANPGKTAEEVYTLTFVPTKAVPVIAINLTHGTGSDVDRFAVATCTRLQYKPVIGYDCIYPLYAIDDPALMTGLSPRQTRYVSVDAVNHVIEACSSSLNNPLALLLGRETVRLVAKYLPVAINDPKDLRARYCLAYAAIIAGTAFDNGLLHFTHALEHPLSAVKPELAHGLGLAMIVPAMVEQIFDARKEAIATLLEPIIPQCKDAAQVARDLEKWLNSVGITQKLADEGFSEADIKRLVHLAQTTPTLDVLLSVAPVEATPERVEIIYRKSLKPMA